MSNKLTNFAKMVDPGVRAVFNDDFKQAKRTSDQICSSMKPEDYITELSSNVGLTMAELRTEQASVKYEDFLAGDTKNLTQYTYSKGIKISKKLMRWNKLGQIKALVQGASQTLIKRKEFDITKLLEQGYSSSTYTHSQDGSTVINLAGGDSAALFSASHATKRTSTAQNNVLYDGSTYNMDLAEDALEAAECYTFPLITDNSDQVIDARPDTLFVSRNKSWVAERLLKSQGRVGTPNNDVNLINGRYSLVVLPYLATAYNAYFFLKDSEINNKTGFLTMLNSVMGEHDGPYVDFDTKCIKHSWEDEYAAGHNNWQSYCGSKGTNAS